MTTVNSPACLLARNFYRSLSAPAEPLQPLQPPCGGPDQPVTLRQRQVTLWLTIAAPAGLMGTTDLHVSIVVRSLSSPGSSAAQPTNPADRRVK